MPMTIIARAQHLPKWWEAQHAEHPTELQKFIDVYQPRQFNKGIDFKEDLIRVLDEWVANIKKGETNATNGSDKD